MDAALVFAGVTAADVLYDIGCNDGALPHRTPHAACAAPATDNAAPRAAGRVCVTAAARCGCRCVGVELDPGAAAKAAAAVTAAGLDARVRITCANALETPLHDASVVFLYLLPAGNARLADKLLAELPRGARVVTHMFRMPSPSWDGRLRATQAVGACRPGGVDTSAFTKLYLYDVGGEEAAAPAGVEGT